MTDEYCRALRNKQLIFMLYLISLSIRTDLYHKSDLFSCFGQEQKKTHHVPTFITVIPKAVQNNIVFRLALGSISRTGSGD